MKEDSHRYDDILMLSHHVSRRHRQMSMSERAAQFSPFAALTGYDAAVRETARSTEEKRELSEEEKQILDRQVYLLTENAWQKPAVEVTYFKPDGLKAGGSYISLSGRFRGINTEKGLLVFEDKTAVPLSDIMSIQTDLPEISDSQGYED